MTFHVLRRALVPAFAGAAVLASVVTAAGGASAVSAPTVVAVPALSAAPSAASSAEPGAQEPVPSGTVTWALEPAGADGPDGRVSLRHQVDAGGTVADTVALTNFSDAPASFEVYAGAGTVTGGGDFDVVAAEPGAAGDAAWVTVGPLDGASSIEGGIRVDLPAASSVLVPLTVRVPSNATPGDHPVGVVAELVAGDDTAVQLAARVGVRVHLRVTGDLVARLSPTQVRATWEPSWNPFSPGTVRLEYVVANEGNVRLGARSVTSVQGPFGAGAASAQAEAREVLPGQSLPMTAEIATWPFLRSTVEVTVRPAVVGEDEVDAALRPVTVSVTAWTIPWAQLVLVVVLAGLVLLVRWLRRRAAARTQARIDAAVAAATAATAEAPPAAVEDSPTGGAEVVVAAVTER